MEDGHLLENEDSRDNIAQTSKETVLMLWTTQTEVNAQDMITQLRDAQGVMRRTKIYMQVIQQCSYRLKIYYMIQQTQLLMQSKFTDCTCTRVITLLQKSAKIRWSCHCIEFRYT